MRVDAFDFDLPGERSALRPARPRDAGRMLVVDGADIIDAGVRDLPSWLRAGDCLVFNDTRVIPAQLEGRRGVRPDGEQSAPGAKIGATLHQRVDLRRWPAFVRNATRPRAGAPVGFRAGAESRKSAG